MSDAHLLVPTAFTDIAQLAVGLVGRIEPERMMLYGPEAYEPGTLVNFSVTLLDGTVALEGLARAVQSVDGGDERDAQIRYDVIFDELTFAGSGTAVFEQLLQIQQNPEGSPPPMPEAEPTAAAGPTETSDIDVSMDIDLTAADDANFEEIEAVELTPAEEPPYEADLEDAVPGLDVTVAGPMPARVMAQVGETSAGVGASLTPVGGPLLRPSLAATWEPVVEAAAESPPDSGYFNFAGGLPTPAAAPRPELDPQFAVAPAPRQADAPRNGAVAGVGSGSAGAGAGHISVPPLEEGPTHAYDVRDLPEGLTAQAVATPGDGNVVELELEDASFEDVAREIEDSP